MAETSNTKGYLGIKEYVVNLILAIIPVTSWIIGGIERIKRGHIVSGLVQLLTPFSIVFWVVDIVTMIKEKDITLWA